MFCGGKREKNENTVFGYKRRSKFKIHIIFENFGRQLTLKGSRAISIFSLALYTEKLKNDKIQFWLQKEVKSQNHYNF